MGKKTQAVSVTDDATKGVDLRNRKDTIIAEISSLLPVQAEGVVWESTYWGKGIGAFHVKGYWTENGKRKPVIVKIQGAEPLVSEVEMISLFRNQNKSTFIRPPEVYGHIPWTQERGYEIIAMEEIEGKPIIQDHMPATQEQVHEFYKVLDEYKANCVTKPWLDRPQTFSYSRDFLEPLFTVRAKQYPDMELWQQDVALAEKVAVVLDRTFTPATFEFMHTHLSVYDLMKYNGEVVVFSNLFWKYRWRFYDYVFAFEWYILGLHAETEDVIYTQIQLWHDAMYASVYGSQNKELVRLSILERYVAALIIDSLLIADEAGERMRIMLRNEINRLYRE